MTSTIVLMYHDVYSNDPSESGFCSPGANYYKLDVIRFEQHVKRVRELQQSGTIKKNVIFTFDDGGVSFYTVIAPILEKYGFIGYFYIATDKIGQEGFLSEPQILKLKGRGHIIGAHSASHPDDMRRLSQHERNNEWEKSIKRINQIVETTTSSVSVPNGYYCKEDIHALVSYNIKTVYTSRIGQDEEINGLQLIGRIAVTSTYTADNLELLLKKSLAVIRLQLKQECLGVIKSLLGDLYMPIKKLIRHIQTNRVSS